MPALDASQIVGLAISGLIVLTAVLVLYSVHRSERRWPRKGTLKLEEQHVAAMRHGSTVRLVDPETGDEMLLVPGESLLKIVRG